MNKRNNSKPTTITTIPYIRDRRGSVVRYSDGTIAKARAIDGRTVRTADGEIALYRNATDAEPTPIA